MSGMHPFGSGWLRDLPDFRDHTPASSEVRSALRQLRRRRSPRGPQPPQIDWREFCSPPSDQGALRSTSAHAVLGMIAYFERRATGRTLDRAAPFLHHTAQRFDGTSGNAGTSLRSTLKALVRFGCPEQRFLTAADAAAPTAPGDPFLYGFQADFAGLHYWRLDRTGGGAEILGCVKSLLAAGFAVVCGASLPCEPRDRDLPFPTRYDDARNAAALTVVGYDDAVRIRSSRGALIVAGTWGTDRGEAGFFRLPYRYVEERLACDFWTVRRDAWTASGEFEQPV